MLISEAGHKALNRSHASIYCKLANSCYALYILLRRICFAGYSDHNAMRLIPHQAHESVLRTPHPAHMLCFAGYSFASGARKTNASFVMHQRCMTAVACFSFALTKKTPDIISGANQIRGTTQILCFCLQSTQYA